MEVGDVPKKNLATVQHQPKQTVYVVDKPGSIQSIIIAGHVGPPKKNPDEIAIETMNTLLGGMFISRLNMNLREDKHWSYGAGTALVDAIGQRTFLAYAPVQTDKTKESMTEIAKEFRGIVRDKPATGEELKAAQDNLTLSMPGSRETANAVGSTLITLVTYGLPDDYYETYAPKVRALATRDISTAAEKLIRPDNLIWVVVGDRSKIEAGIKELNYGELRFIDADGNPQ